MGISAIEMAEAGSGGGVGGDADGGWGDDDRPYPTHSAFISSIGPFIGPFIWFIGPFHPFATYALDLKKKCKKKKKVPHRLVA